MTLECDFEQLKSSMKIELNKTFFIEEKLDESQLL